MPDQPKPIDLDGMRHAADEDDGHGHSLQAAYLRDAADEIERLRAAIRGAQHEICQYNMDGAMRILVATGLCADRGRP